MMGRDMGQSGEHDMGAVYLALAWIGSWYIAGMHTANLIVGSENVQFK